MELLKIFELLFLIIVQASSEYQLAENCTCTTTIEPLQYRRSNQNLDNYYWHCNMTNNLVYINDCCTVTNTTSNHSVGRYWTCKNAQVFGQTFDAPIRYCHTYQNPGIGTTNIEYTSSTMSSGSTSTTPTTTSTTPTTTSTTPTTTSTTPTTTSTTPTTTSATPTATSISPTTTSATPKTTSDTPTTTSTTPKTTSTTPTTTSTTPTTTSTTPTTTSDTISPATIKPNTKKSTRVSNNLRTTAEPWNFDKKLGEMNEKLKNGTIDSNELKEMVEQLSKMSNKIDQNMKNIDRYKLLHFIKTIKNMVRNVNIVLDNSEAWQNITDKDEKVNLSSIILKLVQTSGFALGYNKNFMNTTKIITSNIAIETFSIDNSNDIKLNESESGIQLPRGMSHIRGCDGGTAVGAIVNKLSDYMTVGFAKHIKINSNIIAFSVKNSLNTTPLPDGISPVRIMIKHKQLLKWGDRVDCVYWDFNQSNWSPNGCRFVQINSNRKLSICECNHLTNFALLMDVSGEETKIEVQVKDILTKVFCGLSIVCLILTLGFLTLVPELRNRRNNITSNLCFCLLIVNLLVVFGMDSTYNNALCQTVAALLLYFILCSFSWMLMEGYHLYQMIVLVFPKIAHIRLFYLYAMGYGAPLLIAFKYYLGIGFKNLKESDSYFCWISSPFHPYRVWAVAGPALVVILANGLLLSLAMREVFSSRIKKRKSHNHYYKESQNMAQRLSHRFSWIKGFISLLVLMGITWISFLLYIHDFGHTFSYIFIVLNGLQGVFIFMSQIVFNENTRSLVNGFRKKSSIDTNYSTASHRGRTVSMDRIRNASDSILY